MEALLIIFGKGRHMKNAIKRLIERFHPPREEVGAQWSGILCRSVSEGFTEDPNFSMQERVQQVTIPAMPDVDGVPSEPPPEPLKYYVWVDGKPFPSKAHDARQEAVKEALRLSQKENKYAVVCTDIIKPVTRAEIVELEKG